MIAERIATELRLDPKYVAKVARTASYRYKTYTIPKRTGGTRTIHHPSRELKLLQGWLVDNLFRHIAVHEAAAAYRKGSSIRRLAAIHVSQNYLLKVDFADFFPSITEADVIRVVAQLQFHSGTSGTNLTGDDLQFVKRIVCRNGALTIGAPSSPTLSNAVMYEFDAYWTEETKLIDVFYSRYADDLFFSTNRPGVLSDLIERLRVDIRSRRSPKLTINESKTVFTSRKRRRLLTGLVLTPDRKISLGRHNKRRIRSLVYKHKTDGITDDQRVYLRGYIAYAASVEPGFVATMKRKYGEDLINAI